jgi:hypothetical protein
MSFPIVNKPKSIMLPPAISDTNNIIEVPNLISTDMANELKVFASDANISGLHRRGSKNALTNASFYTCLVFRYDNLIYETLKDVWDLYGVKIDPNITFIEPYEIKMYVEGDKFDNHHDSCGNPETKMYRKINLIIQLSNELDYEGGDLIIGEHKLSRGIGTGIFFPADVYHRVTPIIKGTRFSLIGHGWGPYGPPKF